MRKFFGPEGPLAQHLENYEPREQQIQSAEAVQTAMDRGFHLLMEALCGTGKTFSNLVPPLRDGQRVLYLTGTIALQEQLTQKDLPFLAKLFPGLRYGLVKGKRNYLCQTRLEECTETSSAFRRWAESTKTGDSSELDREPPFWSDVCGSMTECPSQRCKRKECFVYQTRQRMLGWDVTVANYHLAFSLPGFTNGWPIIICDEGDELPDIARNFAGFEYMLHHVRGFVSRGNDLAVNMGDVFNYARDFFASLKGAPSKRLLSVSEDTFQKGMDLVLEVFGREGAFAQAKERTGNQDQIESIQGLWEQISQFASHVEQWVTPEEKRSWAHWAGENFETKERTIAGAPMDVSMFLQKTLFEVCPTIVISSASLSAGDPRFQFIRKELGVKSGTGSLLRLDSPFNLREQSILIVPEMRTSPNDADFVAEIVARILPVVSRIEGRTLGLFTSYKNLKEAGRQLRKKTKLNVLVQGEGTKTKLLEEFRNTPRTVLLGTASFWRGVDVPGDALSCLFLDRLPFPSPGDPLFNAICDNAGEAWFQTESLPRAILRFQQGCGRLIRSCRDRGAIICFDKRIVDKGYGKKFQQAIGSLPVSRRIEDAIEKILEVSCGPTLF